MFIFNHSLNDLAVLCSGFGQVWQPLLICIVCMCVVAVALVQEIETEQQVNRSTYKVTVTISSFSPFNKFAKLPHTAGGGTSTNCLVTS